MKTLDRQKDFGTIIGDTDGRCFVQGETYFDSCDREIKPVVAAADTKLAAKTDVKVDTKPDTKAPDTKTDATLADQLTKQ